MFQPVSLNLKDLTLPRSGIVVWTKIHSMHYWIWCRTRGCWCSYSML